MLSPDLWPRDPGYPVQISPPLTAKVVIELTIVVVRVWVWSCASGYSVAHTAWMNAGGQTGPAMMERGQRGYMLVHVLPCPQGRHPSPHVGVEGSPDGFLVGKRTVDTIHQVTVARDGVQPTPGKHHSSRVLCIKMFLQSADLRQYRTNIEGVGVALCNCRRKYFAL